MDTKVWGPLFWRLLEDVAWAVDSQPQPLREQDGNVVLDFFHSLTGALPCPHCRESYTKFFAEHPIGPALTQQHTLEWVWELHEMVNHKLEKQDPELTLRHLPLEKLQKRMMGWTQAVAALAVWDILFLVVYSMPSQPSPQDVKRRQLVETFVKTVPYVIGFLPVCPTPDKRLLARVLQETELFKCPHRTQRENLLRWLHKARLAFDAHIGWQQCTPSYEQLLSRYSMGTA